MLADPGETVLSARGLIKTFGRVIGLDGVNVDLFPARSSRSSVTTACRPTLIKAPTGALIADPDRSTWMQLEVYLKTPQDARSAGIETVYQTLATPGAGHRGQHVPRSERGGGPPGSVLRMLDKKGMKEDAGKSMANLGIATVQNMSQAVETLSGGQRQAVAVARVATFATKFVVLDEPTAALGVKETARCSTSSSRLASRAAG